MAGGPWRSALAVLLAAMVLGGAAACAPLGSRGAGDDPFARGGGAGGEVVLRVDNLLQEQVTIRVATGSATREVGTVPGRASRQFSVELSGSRLSLQLEPFSGRRHTMPLVSVQAGDVLDLRVVNPIERSVLNR